MKISEHLLASHTRYKTPYYMVKGKKPGPTVILTAGVHGNEIASIRAADQLLSKLRQREFLITRGKLILVPIFNQAAYHKRIRGRPDLNRTFPKSSEAKAVHPLSGELFELAVKLQPDWYIDLHEANGLSSINPKRLGQTLIINPGSKAIPAARRIVSKLNSSIIDSTKHFTVRLKHKEGSGRTAASRLLHAKAITVETCWSLPLTKRIHYQSRIVQYLLEEAHLIDS
ncbi:succinylglutamate desuccinylase/aspartoacylase family protein [Paenibacillus sp. P96]|uniref:Succinylglutamate desuccinylase/aspartoacylase family protein n=1 Tax=Paenibacillus zeirhizosphaerae TaxID=2987519 RepID=A0ABT9FQX4_9BACL|nr:succinylglutamate desuccinylase/aspartoacylase family protein [Paenibacillus sp. P96]MDP4097120.1 succinylglutamate desuccinylase/aspartoacylase family protein [Paenibacillus sp. P96]